MEELTIDNTPVTNEKDQEAVIEAVLFTMGSAVELNSWLLPSDRIKKQQKQRWNG